MPSNMLNNRFRLTADCSEIVDEQTNRRIPASTALRRMFSHDINRLAMDENPMEPRGGGEYNNQPQGGNAMPWDQPSDPTNGNNNGGGTGASVQQAMHQVKAIMRALGNEARGPFISAFQAFLESDEDLDGAPNNNQGAGDRRPGRDGRLTIQHAGDRGRRGAADNTMRGGPPPSMDAQLVDRRSFGEKFPFMSHITMNSFGRV